MQLQSLAQPYGMCEGFSLLVVVSSFKNFAQVGAFAKHICRVEKANNLQAMRWINYIMVRPP